MSEDEQLWNDLYGGAFVGSCAELAAADKEWSTAREDLFRDLLATIRNKDFCAALARNAVFQSLTTAFDELSMHAIKKGTSPWSVSTRMQDRDDGDRTTQQPEGEYVRGQDRYIVKLSSNDFKCELCCAQFISFEFILKHLKNRHAHTFEF